MCIVPYISPIPFLGIAVVGAVAGFDACDAWLSCLLNSYLGVEYVP